MYISVSVNSKGHYEETAIIAGQFGRRFVRPNMSLYSELTERGIYNLSIGEKIHVVETLFPPK